MVEENVLERIIFWRTKRPVGINTREWDTIKQVKSMIEEKYEKQTRDDTEILLLRSIDGI